MTRDEKNKSNERKWEFVDIKVDNDATIQRVRELYGDKEAERVTKIFNSAGYPSRHHSGGMVGIFPFFGWF